MQTYDKLWKGIIEDLLASENPFAIAILATQKAILKGKLDKKDKVGYCPLNV